ncbi:DMT family transporter [Shimia abyssi]|uniref:EamA domain-containing membrane protein RarD n=1 Tax=Shimia abyssi TaxID=1662395 RepID=A0A2P8FFL1_9RHOB|nr:DMT family transporter [Shimia abyssi]PSL20468.1 EamA domain-containing membrane protein RarD [Shimia abyssi]
MHSAGQPTRRGLLFPSVGLFLGGAMWGAIWIPIRAIEHAGPQSAWPGFLLYVCTAVLLLPVLVRSWSQIRQNFWAVASCGLLTGMAFSFYATSLLLTDVVRAILLFYLTPIWGTILGVAVLSERLTLWRALALVAGLGGLLAVLWDGGGVPWPRNTGDWLALASGVAWAAGTLQLHRNPSISVGSQVVAFAWGSLVVTGGLIVVTGDALGAVPMRSELGAAFPLVLATSLYMVPMLFLTIWPARLLTPGRVGLLLMSEVIVAVGTAFWLSGEPFGMREAIGTVLILSSALIEVLGPVFGQRKRRVQ